VNLLNGYYKWSACLQIRTRTNCLTEVAGLLRVTLDVKPRFTGAAMTTKLTVSLLGQKNSIVYGGGQSLCADAPTTQSLPAFSV